MVIGAILRPFIRQAGRQIYQALRAQDRIIDYTYRKTGLYNRGVVRGIKHGLSGGAVIGGTFQLGLNSGTTPSLEDGFQEIPRRRYGTQTRTPYKTRNRHTVCYSRRRSRKPNAYRQR